MQSLAGSFDGTLEILSKTYVFVGHARSGMSAGDEASPSHVRPAPITPKFSVSLYPSTGEWLLMKARDYPSCNSHDDKVVQFFAKG